MPTHLLRHFVGHFIDRHLVHPDCKVTRTRTSATVRNRSSRSCNSAGDVGDPVFELAAVKAERWQCRRDEHEEGLVDRTYSCRVSMIAANSEIEINSEIGNDCGSSSSMTA